MSGSPHTIPSDEDSSTGLSDHSGSPSIGDSSSTINNGGWPTLLSQSTDGGLANGLCAMLGTQVDVISNSSSVTTASSVVSTTIGTTIGSTSFGSSTTLGSTSLASSSSYHNSHSSSEEEG